MTPVPRVCFDGEHDAANAAQEGCFFRRVSQCAHKEYACLTSNAQIFRVFRWNGASMLDDRDRKLLSLLQENADQSVAVLAETIRLSLSACSRRIQRLEEAGYISRRIAVLDRDRIGVPTTVFALIKTTQHSDDWIDGFRRIIRDIPEIVEVHRLTGNYDYILKIVLPRVEHYDVIYKQIVRKTELFDVSASISMEVLKSGGALPVDYAL
jgi:Lrp/AsnC family transcriptional regulator